jgi:cytoskeleton protein RodZ
MDEGSVPRPGARQPPWGEKSEPGTGSFGSWLRRQREMREISLRDIADRTKISLRYLEAMEDDRFDLLPAPIFAKGFLREYARYVGLSPDEVVNHWLSVQQPEELEETKHELRRRDKTRRRSWTWSLFLLLAGALLLALVAVFSHFNDKRREDTSQQQAPPPIAAPPAATTLAATPPPPPEPPKAPLEVTLDFSQDCWVDVMTDGKNRLSELRAQGESLQLEARESIVFLKLGNAGAVDIQVNGYPLELDKQPGEVVSDLRIDLETVRTLREKREAR